MGRGPLVCPSRCSEGKCLLAQSQAGLRPNPPPPWTCGRADMESCPHSGLSSVAGAKPACVIMGVAELVTQVAGGEGPASSSSKVLLNCFVGSKFES
jgi:hypothetical protein